MSTQSVQFLLAADLGTRVVVRTRIPGGFTDALGYLRSCDSTECTVETKRGLVSLQLANVTAAKPVPAPPAGRAGRER